MNMTTASGRNLFTDNIAREVFPSFNLPSSYSLMEKFISEMVLEEVKKKNKEYIDRGEGILRQTRKFKYPNLSSSIGNFSSQEHEKFKGVHWHCDIDSFWKNRYKHVYLFLLKCYIFISKKDNDWRIFKLQLSNLAAFHFETYWKSFGHGLSIDKKRFGCMCEYFK